MSVLHCGTGAGLKLSGSTGSARCQIEGSGGHDGIHAILHIPLEEVVIGDGVESEDRKAEAQTSDAVDDGEIMR